MKLPSWLRSFWSWVCVGFIVASVVFIVGGLSWLSWCYWWDCSCREWLVTGSACRESGSTTLRNLGFVAGGLLAIGFGIWRGVVADRQAKASQQQAETSQLGLLNERCQKGAEMLGSKVLAVRLGGIYVLQHLAEEEPGQYHVQIMRLLCAFVRNPPVDKDRDDNARPTGTEREPNIKDYKVREDVQEAMTAIGARSDDDVELEKKADPPFSPDLSGAYLPFVRLFKANLTDADLTYAKFFPVNLTIQEQNNSKLIVACAYLDGANFSNAFLTVADLTRVHLSGTNLTGTQLAGVKSLTQRQLDQACANPENPPNLSNLRDATTRALLEWRGKPCRK